MRLYRIFLRERAKTAFSGEGASVIGGRWNGVGTRVVYTASHLSLAVLELAVNLTETSLPLDCAYVSVEIPSGVSIARVTPGELPENWRHFPAPPELQALGDRWIQSGSSLALAVPSAVVEIEENVLLNPRHTDFTRLVFADPMPLDIDPRLV